jgi:hypothetical protein
VIVFALLLLLLCSSVVDATTYYVRKTGVDGHTCIQAQNPATAKLTIAGGLGCMVGGDTLLIGNGTYPEQQLDVPSGSSEGTRTIVQAENTGGVILTPQGGAIPGGGEQYNFGLEAWVTLRGIVIDCDYKVTRGIGTGPTSHHIRIQEVEIIDANGQGLAIRESPGFHELLDLVVHGTGFGPGNCDSGAIPNTPGFCHGIYMSSTNVTIDGGRYYNNAGYGMQIYVGNADNAIVQNVRVYDNFATGIGVFRDNTLVSNNLVYGNGGIGIWMKGSNGLAVHNTSWSNHDEGIISNEATTTVVRDNITSHLVAAVGQSVNNFVGGNPLFVSVPLRDFHLQGGSTAIGAATDSTDQGVNFTVLDGVSDAIAPVVAITAPAPAATVSGTNVSVTADASDAVGVVGVQFKLDGVNLGSEDITSTYGVSWNSTLVIDGVHVLSATARDAAGNVGSSATVSVTVSNVVPAPPGISNPRGATMFFSR